MKLSQIKKRTLENMKFSFRVILFNPQTHVHAFASAYPGMTLADGTLPEKEINYESALFKIASYNRGFVKRPSYKSAIAAFKNALIQDIERAISRTTAVCAATGLEFTYTTGRFYLGPNNSLQVALDGVPQHEITDPSLLMENMIEDIPAHNPPYGTFGTMRP